MDVIDDRPRRGESNQLWDETACVSWADIAKSETAEVAVL
jgi:hypothetical protein